MKKSITPNQIKQNNRSLIYQYIYENRKVSQQDIAYDLRLSRPTITTNLSAMEEGGLIRKDGQIDTEFVGRKASGYAIVPDYRVSVGVEILKDEIKMIAVDLYGEKIGRKAETIPFQNEESYFRAVCSGILAFKNDLSIADEQILGIGFAVQGLTTPDRKTILYGEILSCTGLSIEAFSEHLPFPCCFIHDADSAAISELWVSPELTDAFYLSLSKHLGAAIISRGVILPGKHGHSATIEHMQMRAGGKRCYCGRQGCMETLLSMTALLDTDETPEAFFEGVRHNETPYAERWETYLTNLADAVNMLHLIFDTDFIFGGYLAQYMCEQDILFLHEKIRDMTPFSEERDFLRISKMPRHNITVGAALPFIQSFLDSLSL